MRTKKIISIASAVLMPVLFNSCADETTSPEIIETNVTVQSIALNWDNKSNENDAINIRKNLTDKISIPEITKDKKSPALYTVNQKNIKIKVKFNSEEGDNSTIKIQGIPDSENKIFKTTDIQEVKFENGKSKEITFTFNEATPNKIIRSIEKIHWKNADTDKEIAPISEIETFVVFDNPGTTGKDDENPWKLDDNSEQTPWADALRLLFDKEKANLTGKESKEEALKAITKYFFNDHGVYYDIHEEALNHYVHVWEKRFNLTKYLWEMKKENKVSCYTQAGIVYIMSKLIGIDTEVAYLSPWGYINTTNLVGWGECNNPFYEPIGCADTIRSGEKVTDPDDIHRSVFGNHTFIKYNGKIYDATCGPMLGELNKDEYLKKMIDVSTPDEAKESGYPDKFDKEENWNIKYTILDFED
jgi:hypothetical protein